MFWPKSRFVVNKVYIDCTLHTVHTTGIIILWPNVFLGLSFYCFVCVCVCVVMYDDEFDIMENKNLNMEKFKPRHVFL